MTNNLTEQLIKYLTDVHSIEQQALVQMKAAPEIAGDEQIAAAFATHLEETQEHEQLVRQRLEAHGASPSTLKDVAGSVTGKGFVLFARSQPDTPGKLVAHAFSYEHMEQAAYEQLIAVAQQAGDADTVTVAQRILDQERAMGERLEGLFDQALAASLRELEPESLGKQLDTYLGDAHAIESQALQLLEKGQQLAGSADLAAAYRDHLEQTEGHERLIDERLRERGSRPSAIKDAALRLGALNWGAFFQAQPDTPAKLAAFAYAFEHLEIAAYELLGRVARRVADEQTEAVAGRILSEERAAAGEIHKLFPQALDASLQEQGVGAA
jgi:ferritin-like metal-binding protein YciE